jgi:alpha-glucosidase (family GH31 glycosyl hydrolase)
MAGVNQEPAILSVYKKYANLRMNLIPYLYNEALYCCKEGRPMLGHLVLDYPEDRRVLNLEDEYLFGRSLLVAPIIYEGAVNRNIYLPEGIWYDFWSHDEYIGGQEYAYDCPLDKIPVFVKEGSAIPLNLSESLQMGDYTGNDLMNYTCFSFKLFGSKGLLDFKDDIGNLFTLKWHDGNHFISGDCFINRIQFI